MWRRAATDRSRPPPRGPTGGREQHLDALAAVHREYRHALAPPHTEGPQSPGEGADAVVQGLIGQATSAVDQRGLLRIAVRPALQPVPDAPGRRLAHHPPAGVQRRYHRIAGAAHVDPVPALSVTTRSPGRSRPPRSASARTTNGSIAAMCPNSAR